jgi:hypothetical protein
MGLVGVRGAANRCAGWIRRVLEDLETIGNAVVVGDLIDRRRIGSRQMRVSSQEQNGEQGQADRGLESARRPPESGCPTRRDGQRLERRRHEWHPELATAPQETGIGCG